MPQEEIVDWQMVIPDQNQELNYDQDIGEESAGSCDLDAADVGEDEGDGVGQVKVKATPGSLMNQLDKNSTMVKHM